MFYVDPNRRVTSMIGEKSGFFFYLGGGGAVFPFPRGMGEDMKSLKLR